jgi:RES domain
VVGKLPHPPERLPPPRKAELRVLSAGTQLWRIYFAGGEHATTWNEFRRLGPLGTARFDHHEPPPHLQDRGTLYAADRGPAAFAECFQATRTINRTRRDPWLVCFTLDREVTLLDLGGGWPTRAGASQAINSGPRSRAREWSRSIFDQFPAVEGLRYPSSMLGGAVAVALYERAEDAIADRPILHVPLTHPGLQVPIQRLAFQLGYGVA